MNTDSHVLKGLNIAIVVLASLGILVSILMATLFSAGSVWVLDPNVSTMIEQQINAYPEFREEVIGFDTVAVASNAMGMAGGLFGVVMIAKIIALIAGILGIRNADRPDHLGVTFALAIIAAIVNFIFGGIIEAILLVISAVYIARVRKTNVSATPAY